MLFNQPRAERIMARDGIDALVATSPDNVMYGTDYECTSHWVNKGFQVYSLFTPAHAPKASLIAPGLELEALVDGDVWIEDVYIFSPFPRGPAGESEMDRVGRAVDALQERAHSVPRAIDALVAAIEARKLEKGRIAVDEIGMSPAAFAELERRGAVPEARLVQSVGLGAAPAVRERVPVTRPLPAAGAVLQHRERTRRQGGHEQLRWHRVRLYRRILDLPGRHLRGTSDRVAGAPRVRVE